MREPSRPCSVRPDRSQMGSRRASSGISWDSGRPSSSPWYRVDRPGQGQSQQQRGPCPCRAQGHVDLPTGPCPRRVDIDRGERLRVHQAVPADRAVDVVAVEGPGRHALDVFEAGQGLIDGKPECSCLVWLLEQIEVEDLIQLTGPDVVGRVRGRQPYLAQQGEFAVVAVDDPTPALEDFVHAGLVPQVGIVAVWVDEIRKVWVLDHRVGDVDPEAVDAPVEPGGEHLVEHRGHIVVVPVEVGLAGVEAVEVPLLGRPARVGSRPARRRWIASCLVAPCRWGRGRPGR